MPFYNGIGNIKKPTLINETLYMYRTLSNSSTFTVEHLHVNKQCVDKNKEDFLLEKKKEL